MIIMHELAWLFPVKSPNYFIAEALSNPLLNLLVTAKHGPLKGEFPQTTMWIGWV